MLVGASQKIIIKKNLDIWKEFLMNPKLALLRKKKFNHRWRCCYLRLFYVCNLLWVSRKAHIFLWKPQPHNVDYFSFIKSSSREILCENLSFNPSTTRYVFFCLCVFTFYYTSCILHNYPSKILNIRFFRASYRQRMRTSRQKSISCILQFFVLHNYSSESAWKLPRVASQLRMTHIGTQFLVFNSRQDTSKRIRETSSTNVCVCLWYVTHYSFRNWM